MDALKKTNNKPVNPAIEIKVFWNNQLENVAQLDLHKDKHVAYKIGENFSCDYPVSPLFLEGETEFSLIKTDPLGNPIINVPPHCKFRSFTPENKDPEHRVAEENTPLALTPNQKTELFVGELTFQISVSQLEKNHTQIMRPALSMVVFLACSAIGHILFLTYLANQPIQEYQGLDINSSSNPYYKIMFEPYFKQKAAENAPPKENDNRFKMLSRLKAKPTEPAMAGGRAITPEMLMAYPITDNNQSLGYGGLGLSGTGRGGGGTGHGTIGLGNLNTIGHGAGGGSGAYYGRGTGANGGIRARAERLRPNKIDSMKNGPKKTPRYGIRSSSTHLANSNQDHKINANPLTRFNTESYKYTEENGFFQVKTNPLSTFSIDVDTASYSNIRRFIHRNAMPPKDAVRIEEMINYFSYDYPTPKGEHPFSVNVETSKCPWNPDNLLTRIGLKGFEIKKANRPAANLVFLIDVSGSMRAYNKLPLLQKSMRMLVNNLNKRDKIAIVVYAGASGLALQSTACANKESIIAAIESLSPGGSTNGGEGIQLAYKTALQNYIPGGTNRVILATDGDFNVGTTSEGSLTRLIAEKAKSNVFLTVLGFGMGNYKDAMLETLADKGNGNYAYIDTIEEARKVLIKNSGQNLITIAKDVKLQVEFNPQKVGAYRLIGYENRVLNHRDFNDDHKDAGEIGAGHTVTALYELMPPTHQTPAVDSLKYQQLQHTAQSQSNELYTVKLRYKKPNQNKSKRLQVVVQEPNTHNAPSIDFKFQAAVASFGMLLKDSPNKGTATYKNTAEMALEGLGPDKDGYRSQFINMILQAKQTVGG